jgi:thiol:disulfide interchange protein DsbD
VSVGLLGLLALAGHTLAQDPKPQRKDTSERLKPREVVLSAAVSPDRVAPGGTVTYTVTAKVAPGWHIYANARNQPDEGPRATQFDFFRLDGLKVLADWAPARPPIRKKEPAFPDLEAVEFHEGETSWSIRLQVPPGTSSGVKTLQSQIYFQICDANSCKPPAYVTVPPATLTVTGNEQAARSRSILTGLAAGLIVPPRDEPQPARKDSNPRFRPKEVELSTAVEPIQAPPGANVTFRVTAKVAPGWHIYAYGPVELDEGPRATRFDFFDRGPLEQVGDWTASSEPIRKREEAFPDLPFVEYHEGEITWSTKLQVPADAPPGPVALRCQIAFQICTDLNCLPPVNWTAPEAVVTIIPADTAAPAPAPVVAPSTSPERRSPAAIADGSPERASLNEGKRDAPGTGVEETAPEASRLAQATSLEAPTKTTPITTSSTGGAAEQKIEQGLLPFLAWSALGGLFALLMPCVWPMVPVTVNFFVKQGQTKQGTTTRLAITYCLSIILIFTLVGLVFSAVFGASALVRLANNAWLNLVVGLLFIAFGLSLLGLFEISLPSSLLNASARGESRGGLIGVVFMALTLTITSFTCTFPVVGALVVMAARGSFFYPIVGLATFATVLALPFFLLALSPGLLKSMPRSGDWMNSIKVVGGLVEIGAAFKFLNTAEIAFGATPDEAWLDSEVLLAIWVVLCVVCGLYLLGLFKTDHDYDEVKVGAGRMLGGALFLALALYLAPALFGFPPQSQVYNRLVVGILPADSSRLSAPELVAERTLERLPEPTTTIIAGDGSPARLAEPAEAIREVKATSSDPVLAVREQKSVHGVVWGLSYDAAIEEAKAKRKPVLIDFTGVNCANCRLMEKSVMPHPQIVPLLKQFVTVQLYTDFVPIDTLTKLQKEELAEANLEREVEMTNETTSPLYVIVTPDEKVIAHRGGYIEPDVFARFLQDGLAAAQAGGQARGPSQQVTR